MLAPGTTVELLTSKLACTVEKLIGQGGQGAVFLVRMAERGNRAYALKWYFPRSATEEQWRALNALLDKPAPNERFLWPIDLAVSRQARGFGYLMPLRDPSFVGLADLMSGQVDVPFRELATTGLELAHSFMQLHNLGLCYRDISFGNVFFAPATGAVLVCDVDNVGINEQSVSGVRGTLPFMAPEILREEAVPSTDTDLWSLAVLLFFMFLVHHPLVGRRELDFQSWDEDAMVELFGRHPVFVFDPDDRSNEPVPGVHDTPLALWPIYPVFLRKLFVKAFTSGIRDPRNGRVRDGVWRAAMVRLRDSIVYCQSCAKQNFFDAGAEARGDPVACWNCQVAVTLPLRLEIAGRTTMLNFDTVLYAHHIRHDYDFKRPVARVVRHPQEPSAWGLRNLTDVPWNVTAPNGDTHRVEPQRCLTLRPKVSADFGGVRGEIRA